MDTNTKVKIILGLLLTFLIIKIHNNFNTLELFNEKTNLHGFDIKDVQTLTFQKNKYTSGNRTSPVPQLQCIGGNSIDKAYIVESVQCQNMGLNDDSKTQWKCNSDLPSNLSIGTPNINCEGLKNEYDNLKLVNSCTLEYTLNDSNKYDSNYNTQNSWKIIFIFCFIFLIFFSIVIQSKYSYSSHSLYSPYSYSPYISYPMYIHRSSPLFVNTNYFPRKNNITSFKTSTSFGSTSTR